MFPYLHAVALSMSRALFRTSKCPLLDHNFSLLTRSFYSGWDEGVTQMSLGEKAALTISRYVNP